MILQIFACEVFMRSNVFKEAKISILILSIILCVMILFFLIASMFISMGFKNFEKNKTVMADFTDTPVIIIDPGHGGIDSGATANGLIEKDLNLEISILLSDYLTNCGYDVVLTRTDDVLLFDPQIPGSRKSQDLNNRVSIANSYDNVYFISVHMNKFPTENCKGFQAFYSENNDVSKVLAEKLQHNVILLQSDNKRKIKNGTDNIYLLEKINSPAVLVECGFISNKEESYLLKTNEYKQALAFAIFCGIADCLENC